MRPGARVTSKQIILLWRAPWDEVAVPTDIPILYEDEHLLAVDKPAKLPVHPTARYHKNTLIKMLQSARPGQFLSLGHRLDRETSGVLLVSKTRRVRSRAQEAISSSGRESRRCTRRSRGVFRANRASACASIAASSSIPRAARKFSMRIGRTEDALSATTIFHGEEVAGDYALVRCDLLTGRQHQIRVHLASLGTPIVGDKLYGIDESFFVRAADGELTEDDLAALELPRHALHATHLRLPHPMTRAPLAVTAPLPDDMKTFWSAIKSRAGRGRDRPDRAPRE